MRTHDIIRVATDAEILATRDVMLQLRPHVPPDEYLPTVRRLMATQNFRLAAVRSDDRVCAVAGYRIMEMLYCGRMLYVDDLVSDAAMRSHGFGGALLKWLRGEATAEGCAELHLDSRVDRAAAHRFYFRERFTIFGFHFATRV